MSTCLLGLGSNVGDRSVTMRQALESIDALPDVQVARRSKDYAFASIGGPPNQDDFLNVAAVIETRIPPLPLLAELQRVETFHGRTRGERWAPRTLDIDLLLYSNDVVETEMLTLPHPRMSFRRFVLVPAAEIAPRILHPIIGWPIEQLLMHLDAARDQVAIVSPIELLRRQAAELLIKRFGASATEPPQFPNAEHHWPKAWSHWLDIPSSGETRSALATTAPLPYAASDFPKLTILIDPAPGQQLGAASDWTTLVRQPGRGPTLRVRARDAKMLSAEVVAAIESVWAI